MSVVKDVEVPYPYTAEVRRHGGRVHRLPVYGWTSARIPVVLVSDAPVVLRAEGVRVARDGEPQDMAWRAWRGLNWRPVLDDKGAPQRVDAEEFFAEPPMSPRTRRWIDHPYGRRLGARYVEGPDALGWWPPETPEFLPRHDRVVGGNREEAGAAVVALAAAELAEIGGVLHKRAALPMWALGWSPRLDGYDGGIALVVPDFGGRAPPSLGLVPAMHLDVAQELAARLVRRGRANRPSRWTASADEDGEPKAPEGSVEAFGNVPSGDEACHTLLHAYEMFTAVVDAAPYRPKPATGHALDQLLERLSQLNDAPLGMHHFARELADAALGRAFDLMQDEPRPRHDLLAVLSVPLAVGERCRDYEWDASEEWEAVRLGR
ncbi:hypothetical protein [Methylorubrum thiocyanatum]|uniref:Uncharacterized protein n=1 Tax=Methylorubrum thiocyanatum TaxID=47958 RepID=A0AA40VB39_9HYPH|nr:hypothetical protein [Methylorubrum thiocyanatum]MBA8912226.1 hypothetical protein [Methylorubrum thiocyanatum]GJE81021.1 hypothetical protein CJNNKLLH_2362 [Methylorubrum thiocyanatum]